MISFAPTQEQSLIVDTVRSFAREVLRPAARVADEAEALPETLLQRAWQLGFVGAQIPEAYGGGGAARSPLTGALVLEALAFGDPALAIAITHSAAFVFALVDQGSERQKQEFLPLFCGAEFRTASLALMEPVPLFGPHKIASVAVPTDGGFVLSGTKCCVPLADHASHFLVLARIQKHDLLGRLEAFIVPRSAPGLSLMREHNLGLRALPTSRLTLHEVPVARADRLGESAGFEPRHLFATSRTASAALLLGLSCAVMDYVIPYAKERRAFGQFIAQKQAVAFMLSSMRVETDAMRWLTWKAASQLEQQVGGPRAAHSARNYASEQTMKIADDGLQVLGGHGYIREHPVELWYRSARTLSVLEGAACL